MVSKMVAQRVIFTKKNVMLGVDDGANVGGGVGESVGPVGRSVGRSVLLNILAVFCFAASFCFLFFFGGGVGPEPASFATWQHLSAQFA